MPESHQLIWDSFFSIEPENESVKYPFAQLLGLEHGRLKQVLDEYLFRVYFENYQENGLRLADIFDPKLLSLLGLPPHSGSEEIRQRFQELAKFYHPDLGGDSAKLIELIEIYGRLQNGRE